jgi:hypothetical protein
MGASKRSIHYSIGIASGHREKYGERVTTEFGYCYYPLASRSKWADPANGVPRCYLEAGHSGPHRDDFHLSHLRATHPKVAEKIDRDATMTTGAPWKSEKAGPNRILRWALLRSNEELQRMGLDLAGLEPGVIRKLKGKAATYDVCMAVSRQLAHSLYSMTNAPRPPDAIQSYLETAVGAAITFDSTRCLICRDLLDFNLFKEARRGRGEIETAHADPRKHTPANVGFAHRACNIAQGEKTLDEFYSWIAGILDRVKGV